MQRGRALRIEACLERLDPGRGLRRPLPRGGVADRPEVLIGMGKVDALDHLDAGQRQVGAGVAPDPLRAVTQRDERMHGRRA